MTTNELLGQAVQYAYGIALPGCNCLGSGVMICACEATVCDIFRLCYMLLAMRVEEFNCETFVNFVKF